MDVQTKTCSRCKAERSVDEFYRKYKHSEQRHSKCKECSNTLGKEYRRASPDYEKRLHVADPTRRRRYKVKTKYGLTWEQYQDLLNQSGGLCEICKQAPGTGVDHDHKTGKVRGMLCVKCNAGLGHFNESLDILAKAIEYVVHKCS